MKRITFLISLAVLSGILFNNAATADDMGVALSAYDPGQSFDPNQGVVSASQVMALDHDISAKKAPALFNQANDAVAGNPQGKVTLVEFFDYQCSHCINMLYTIRALIKENPNLRVVYKDFPIRGDVSLYAAKAALAAKNQGKYLAMHEVLLKSGESLTENKIITLATSLGLDIKKLKADIDSDIVNQQIKDNYQLAQALQIQGTPAFFIGKTVLPATPTASIDFINGQVAQQVLQQSIFNKTK